MTNIIKAMDILANKFIDEGYSDDEALEELLANGYTKEDFKAYGNIEWAEITAKEHGIEL